MVSTKKEILLTPILFIGYFALDYVFTLKTNSLSYGIFSIIRAALAVFLIYKIIGTTNLANVDSFFHSAIQKYSYWIIGILYIFFISYVTELPSNWISMIHLPLSKVSTYFLIALSAGLFEEFFCRGLLFNIFYKVQNSLLLTAIYSSAVFALLHLSNFFFIKQGLVATLQQMVFAFALGIFFSFLRITFNSLWLPILIHTAIDFSPQIVQADGQNSWSDVLFFLVTLAIPMIILLLFTKNKSA